jgi:hypothetical protein
VHGAPNARRGLENEPAADFSGRAIRQRHY